MPDYLWIKHKGSVCSPENKGIETESYGTGRHAQRCQYAALKTKGLRLATRQRIAEVRKSVCSPENKGIETCRSSTASKTERRQYAALKTKGLRRRQAVAQHFDRVSVCSPENKGIETRADCFTQRDLVSMQP